MGSAHSGECNTHTSGPSRLFKIKSGRPSRSKSVTANAHKSVRNLDPAHTPKIVILSPRASALAARFRLTSVPANLHEKMMAFQPFSLTPRLTPVKVGPAAHLPPERNCLNPFSASFESMPQVTKGRDVRHCRSSIGGPSPSAQLVGACVESERSIAAIAEQRVIVSL